MGLGLVLGGPSLEKQEGDPAVFSVIPRPDWVTGTKTPDVHGGFCVLSRWGSQEGGAPEPGQYLPCGLGCDKLFSSNLPTREGGPSSDTWGCDWPPPDSRPATQPSWLQRGGREAPAAVPEWGPRGRCPGTGRCGRRVEMGDMGPHPWGPARGPGTAMQSLRLRKGDRNMGHGTRTPCTAQAHPGLRMWGQRLQMPARLQPAGQHRIGLAGAWACSGARVGWRRCGVKGLKGEHPDPGHSPDPGHRLGCPGI